MRASRRDLKSYASGLANQFTASANHYAWLSLQHTITTVTIDVLAIQIAPVEFDIDRNRKLVELCLDNLRGCLEYHGLQELVQAVELVAKFDVSGAFDGRFGRYVPSTVTASITDDRGKSWVVVLNEPGKLAQS